ncbi:hypothetical protein V6N13_025072 [Hibiscus sabdariffa]|uniref:Uncharacterized protein n=1 Tax=Hibiscus sabdariffa TaxID=183260 RepID=A0ABR2BB87_9ROSI
MRPIIAARPLKRYVAGECHGEHGCAIPDGDNEGIVVASNALPQLIDLLFNVSLDFDLLLMEKKVKCMNLQS